MSRVAEGANGLEWMSEAHERVTAKLCETKGHGFRLVARIGKLA